MTKAWKSYSTVVICVLITLSSACGGGGSGGSGNPPPSVTTYQVSATAGTGGSISPASATVNAGGTTTFTVTANTGYVISSVTGCGGTLTGNTYTVGAVNASCTVTASFLAQYTVTASAGAGGAISPSSAAVNAGGTTTFAVTANTGYLVGGMTGCSGTLSGNTYTTGVITANCAVTASFSAVFTWFGGSTTPDAVGVHGTQGIASAMNVPSARDDGVTWTDPHGNLWLFGGFAGYVTNVVTGDFLNDLWEYSPSSGQWIWISGSNTVDAQGVYGTKGVAAASNVPGARSNLMSWTDTNGNLWLFGGGGVDSTGNFVVFDDLWMFSPSSGEWTWEGGSSTTNATGVYGIKGVASVTNMPGAREISNTIWVDAAGNVWLFGGDGYDSTGTYTRMNDLWEYSPSSGEWTWVGGSSTVSPTGVYGTQGVAAATNVLPGRSAAVGWTDASGNFWLFGGEGYDPIGGYYHRFNDLWKYSLSSGEWTWFAGSNTFDATGVYGTQGVAAATNVIGARAVPFAWKDSSGNVWLFGGYQYDDSTNTRFEMNDLWFYPMQ